MLKLTPLCLASVLLLQLPASAVHAQATASVADQSIAKQIDASIASHYKANGPGATVLVVKNGTTLLRKGYGMADVAGKVPMRPEMTMRLGSITKQFTAVGILMLADEGKLAVSDPITKYLPDYPTHGKTITIEHLLTHTSGIVSYTSKKDFGANVTRDMTVQQMIDSFKNDPLEFEPGTRYAYNNSGYFLLGAIIEKLSGKPYAKFMEERIFVPLGMTQTAYEGMERSAGPRAAGHTSEGAGFTPSTPLSMTQPYAAGALVSNVDDLARWENAIASGRLLKPASWKMAHTTYRLADGKPTNYGYGWEIRKVRGAHTVSHGGGIPGFSTYALRMPQDKVFVAVLSNADSGLASTGMIASHAAAVAIGQPYPVRTAISMDGAALDALSGVYKISDKATRTIRRDKGNLVMEREGRPPVTLFPYAKGEFFVNDADVTFKFGRNDKGVVDKLILVDEDKETVNERIGDAAAPAKPL